MVSFEKFTADFPKQDTGLFVDSAVRRFYFERSVAGFRKSEKKIFFGFWKTGT